MKTLHRTLDAADAAPPWVTRYVTVAGRCYGTGGVGAVLGLTPDEVHAELAQGHLLAIDGPDGEPLFPLWQFPHGKLLPNLAEVLAVLSGDPIDQAEWFVRCRRELDGQPPALWLQHGDPAAVLALAGHIPAQADGAEMTAAEEG